MIPLPRLIIPAALASSISICIAKEKLGSTLIKTFLNIRARGPLVSTQTNSLFFNPNLSASLSEI